MPYSQQITDSLSELYNLNNADKDKLFSNFDKKLAGYSPEQLAICSSILTGMCDGLGTDVKKHAMNKNVVCSDMGFLDYAKSIVDLDMLAEGEMNLEGQPPGYIFDNSVFYRTASLHLVNEQGVSYSNEQLAKQSTAFPLNYSILKAHTASPFTGYSDNIIEYFTSIIKIVDLIEALEVSVNVNYAPVIVSNFSLYFLSMHHGSYVYANSDTWLSLKAIMLFHPEVLIFEDRDKRDILDNYLEFMPSEIFETLSDRCPSEFLPTAFILDGEGYEHSKDASGNMNYTHSEDPDVVCSIHHGIGKRLDIFVYPFGSKIVDIKTIPGYKNKEQ